MKKSDTKDFADFLLQEAKRYVREIHPQEVATWFETFKKTTIDDFKAAWAQHKNHPKHGGFFPNIPMLQAILRTTGSELAARDWRCSEQIGNERCQYAGGIFVAGSREGYCASHFRIKGSADYTEAASMQIIEASKDYQPPKTPMELMERGAAQRAEEGTRWRKARGIKDAPTRQAGDAYPAKLKAPTREPGADEDEAARAEADARVAAADAVRIEQINRDLAMAQQAAE